MNDVTCAAKAGRAVPLLVGKNDLELDSFLQKVASRHSLNESSMVRVVNDEMPRFESEYEHNDRLRMIVFRNGDRISEALQAAYSHNALPRFRVFIPVVTMPAKELFLTKRWTESFFRTCSRTFIWPSWADRKEDQANLLTQMNTHLPAYDLETEEAKAYVRTFIGGTKSVYHLLRRAVAAARREHPSHERAQVNEYHLNVADTVRDRDATPVPQPTRSSSHPPSEQVIH